MGIHGLQGRGLVEGRRGCLVLPEMRMRKAQSVPGAVELRVQAGRFAEGCYGLFVQAPFVVRIAQIEMCRSVAGLGA